MSPRCQQGNKTLASTAGSTAALLEQFVRALGEAGRHIPTVLTKAFDYAASKLNSSRPSSDPDCAAANWLSRIG